MTVLDVSPTRAGGCAEYDMVIGVDGLRSTTRKLVFGPEEHYAHPLGAYVSYFSVAREGLPLGWGDIATNRRRMAGVSPARDSPSWFPPPGAVRGCATDSCGWLPTSGG